MTSEPAPICENNASFKQINTPKMLIALKMANSSSFSFGVTLDFPECLQIKFYNINYWSMLDYKCTSLTLYVAIYFNHFHWYT